MSRTRSQAGEAEALSPADRLNSWREIADYLQRDQRTVQRWAQEAGLPVHRQLNKSRASVFAFKSEVDAWLRKLKNAQGLVPQPAVTQSPTNGGNGNGTPRPQPPSAPALRPTATPGPVTPVSRRIGSPQGSPRPTSEASSRRSELFPPSVAPRPQQASPFSAAAAAPAPLHTPISRPRPPQRPSALSSTPSRGWGWVWNWVPLAATCGLILLVLVAAASSEIWRISATRRSGRIQSLAVLPLRDLSEGARDEYFADGISEMLTNNLGHLGGFRVIGRASVMPYRDGSKAPWQIARNLKVDAVIQGYVRLAGERVQVTAQLIETKSEAHIWSKTYERDLRDALTFEGEIAQDIAYELQAKVTPRQQFRLTNRKAAEPEVRDAYFKGRYYSSQLSCASFQTALENFQRAAIAAPNFALAYAGLASSYSRLAEFGCLPGDEAIPKARAAATRAISLDQDLAEAHTVLGTISFLYDWDWATAHSELRRATELNPSDALARAWYGAFLFSIGKSSEAFAELHKAKSIDPASGTATLIYAFTLYNSRRYDEAIEQFQRVISNYPDSTPAYFGMAVCYERKRMRSKALKNYLKAKELSGADPETVVTLRKASANGGLQGFWRKELELTKMHPDTCWQTISAAHVGDKQQTLALLEQAYDERCSVLAWLKADPLYDRVRSEAQFQALIRRMALPGTASPDRLRKRANSRRMTPNSRLIVPARSG